MFLFLLVLSIFSRCSLTLALESQQRTAQHTYITSCTGDVFIKCVIAN